MSESINSLYDFDAARGAAQRRRMESLQAAGICVFCPEHVAAHQPEPIEHMGDYWYVTKNHYPYDGAAAHYLIVSRTHVVSFDELPDEAGAELWSIRRSLKERLAPAALATVERSGNMLYNGGSVAHLHVHVVALNPSPSATVRFRVSAYGADDAG
jgi:diadenosine tetraphosphate (Ap4A) HIT family hydrolase